MVKEFELLVKSITSIFPVPNWMFSSNVRTILLPVATFVALSVGTLLSRVGAVSSAVVKFKVVLSRIPAKALLLKSTMAGAAVWMA